jgi:hypothetical protein
VAMQQISKVTSSTFCAEDHATIQDALALCTGGLLSLVVEDVWIEADCNYLAHNWGSVACLLLMLWQTSMGTPSLAACASQMQNGLFDSLSSSHGRTGRKQQARETWAAPIAAITRHSQTRPLQESRARRRGVGGRRSSGAAASMDADPRGAGALPGHGSDSGRPTGRQQPGEEEREEGKGWEWIRLEGGRLTCGVNSDGNWSFRESVGSSHQIMKSSIFTKGYNSKFS